MCTAGPQIVCGGLKRISRARLRENGQGVVVVLERVVLLLLLQNKSRCQRHSFYHRAQKLLVRADVLKLQIQHIGLTLTLTLGHICLDRLLNPEI